VDIPPSQVNILDGNAIDLIAECNAYEAKIKAMGGIELFLGGIGEDGHIAFNVMYPSVMTPEEHSHGHLNRSPVLLLHHAPESRRLHMIRS
jgi:6-phosphogluconolactonase/glucosamine-6-phosphate isomerase/deaminase